VKLPMQTKEEIIKNTSAEELWSLFENFKQYFNQIYSPNVIEMTDQQIMTVVERMKESYAKHPY